MKFREFTETQIEELTTRYGSMDILRLDGGQVLTSEGQNIGLDGIIDKAHLSNPECWP